MHDICIYTSILKSVYSLKRPNPDSNTKQSNILTVYSGENALYLREDTYPPFSKYVLFIGNYWLWWNLYCVHVFSFWPNSMEKLNRSCWAGDKSCPGTVCVGNQFSSGKILWEISLWQNTVGNFSTFPAENVLKNNCLPVEMTQIPLAFMGIYVFVMLQRPIIGIR